jgi:hypothetical protein
MKLRERKQMCVCVCVCICVYICNFVTLYHLSVITPAVISKNIGWAARVTCVGKM